jgi:hypothetical protein
MRPHSSSARNAIPSERDVRPTRSQGKLIASPVVSAALPPEGLRRTLSARDIRTARAALEVAVFERVDKALIQSAIQKGATLDAAFICRLMSSNIVVDGVLSLLCKEAAKQRVRWPASEAGRVLGLAISKVPGKTVKIRCLCRYGVMDCTSTLASRVEAAEMLQQAVIQRDNLTTEALMISGASPTLEFTLYTTLHAAVLSESPSTLDILLKYGANANVTTYRGDTPLHYARTWDCFHVLLMYGANPWQKNDSGEMALSGITNFKAGRPRAPPEVVMATLCDTSWARRLYAVLGFAELHKELEA